MVKCVMSEVVVTIDVHVLQIHQFVLPSVDQERLRRVHSFARRLYAVMG